MTTPIISVRNLSKVYRIGTAPRHDTLRDQLVDGLNRLVRRKADGPAKDKPAATEFWALKDVSFEVQPGEIVGIIGRNGAGKSTLLKLLSQITEPTAGEIRMRGRVASLLEVGTGFHPELTGRENIFLNGAILGMTQAEIRGKFDEIVDFSGIEKFLDTPVKRYSSGMYVRLAFAVAAHLEPEILIVDEVLAVGDSAFQRKCITKMESAGKLGSTVLVVSHNLATVNSLCTQGILLTSGQISFVGPISSVIASYIGSDTLTSGELNYDQVETPPGDSFIKLMKIKVSTVDLPIDCPLEISLQYKIQKESDITFVPSVDIYTADGTYAFGLGPKFPPPHGLGTFEFKISVPGGTFNDGIYFIGCTISSFSHGTRVHFFEKSLLSINVKDHLENTRLYGYLGPIAGIVRPQLPCTIERVG